MRNSNIFVPLLCSFAILDQIGTCYRDGSKSQPQDNASGVKKALHNFCHYHFESMEAIHLYAFRNGLMHDASFTSKDRKGNWYCFRLNKNLGEVIRPATRYWSGCSSDFSDETTTYINGQLLQDMAQNTANTLGSEISNIHNKIEITPSREELIHKYLLWLER